MLRRLAPEQPDSFAFTDANRRWASAQIAKYPEGREASAIIPLLWRAQEQEGWLSRPAIEHVADMLGLAYIRALEVATFYFMFQLHPVGSLAHVQICGTLSCMICGAEDLMAVCQQKIAPRPHMLSADGKFSWEEVECLGACANAPMAQIGKDYYEDLTTERLTEILDELAAGKVPVPGPQNGRYSSEPVSGLTSLKEYAEGRPEHNASVALAVELGDTVKRIDGTETPLVAPWIHEADEEVPSEAEAAEIAADRPGARPAEDVPADETGITEQEAPAASRAKPRSKTDPAGEAEAEDKGTARDGGAGSPDADGNRDASPPAGDAEDNDRGSSSGAAGQPEVADSTQDTPPARADDADVPDDGSAPSAAPESEPELLDAPRGEADDLKRISGVGPKIEDMLHEMGIWHFSQIAAWGPQEVTWVDNRLRFKGRIEREDWVAQARRLQSE